MQLIAWRTKLDVFANTIFFLQQVYDAPYYHQSYDTYNCATMN